MPSGMLRHPLSLRWLDADVGRCHCAEIHGRDARSVGHMTDSKGTYFNGLAQVRTVYAHIPLAKTGSSVERIQSRRNFGRGWGNHPASTVDYFRSSYTRRP